MVKNGVYNFLGGIARLALGILTVPLLIRLLGISQYGVYTMASALVSFAALAEWSIALTVTVFLSEDLAHPDTTRADRTLKAALLVVLGLAMTTGLLLLGVSFGLPAFFDKLQPAEAAEVRTCCQVGAGLVVLRLAQQFLVGLLQAHRRYGTANSLSTAYTLILSVATLAAAWLYKALLPLFIVQSLVTALFLLLYIAWSFRLGLLPLRFLGASFDAARLRALAAYSLRTWAGSFGSVLFTQGDRLIVGKLLGSELVGVYAALTSTTYQINALSSLPLQPMVPELSRARTPQYAPDGTLLPSRLNESKLVSAYRLNVYLAMLLGGLLVGLSPEVLQFLSLPAKEPGLVTSLIVLGVIYTTYSFNALGYYVLLALQETRIYLRIQLLSGLASLTAIALLAAGGGLNGAILGNVLYLSVFSFTYQAVRKLALPMRSFLQPTLLPLLALRALAAFTTYAEALPLRWTGVAVFAGICGWQFMRTIRHYRATSFLANSL